MSKLQIPHLLGALSGVLLALSVFLASDSVSAYGWSALSAYVGVQCALPLVRQIKNEVEEGGEL